MFCVYMDALYHCRQKDLEMFLDHTRAKFVGFQVKHDNTSLAGLPQPIHEGVKVLKQVMRASKFSNRYQECQSAKGYFV
jgi:hypothetical protein